MAKKQFDLTDDFAATLTPPAAAPPRGRRAFDAAIETDARVIADVTDDKMMAGRYKRQQILLPPGQIEYIARLATDLGISKLELYRWIVDRALTAIEAGERPDVTVRTVVGETVKKHWTSE
jgi:hypothetical protein